MQIGVITNPNSRKNRNRPNRAAELRSIVGTMGEVHETDTVDSIKPILRDFLRKRARYWVADGGDGALHWMLRSAMEVLDEEEFSSQNTVLPLTMPTNGGTIDFIAGNAGIKGSAETLLSKLRRSIERGSKIDEVLVDSMLIEGIEVVDGREQPLRTFGFASAAGGVGQRFFGKYYEEKDPNAKSIVKILANTIASMPVAMSPLRAIPMLPKNLRNYAREMFEPTGARLSIDGMILPRTAYNGIHIASMPINLGNVLRFFTKAEQPGLMHAIVGQVSPLNAIRNLPNMHLGREIKGREIVDRACRELTMEAVGDELLAPVIDGEVYQNVKKMTFSIGPRIRIPKVVDGAA